MSPSSPNHMDRILNHPLGKSQAALWFLGQAGYVIRAANTTVAIDPYLSDSVGMVSPKFSRAAPVPIEPEELRVDVYMVTHDHLDHLDPETVHRYAHKDTTLFVAPRLACRKLLALGVPAKNVIRLDSGEQATVAGVAVQGVYAVPTSPDAIDTAGYRLEFPNGRSVYHSADTGFSELLLEAAPPAEVLLVCINGKWGNLNVHQAVRLAQAVKCKVAIPNHYDVMALNSEDPESFLYFLSQSAGVDGRVLQVMEPFVW